MKSILARWLARLALLTLWQVFPRFEIGQEYIRLILPSGKDIGPGRIIDKDFMHVYLRFTYGGYLPIKKWSFCRVVRIERMELSG